MKFDGSNCLRFELDRDHSPDPGAGFTPDFLILAGFQQVMDQFL